MIVYFVILCPISRDALLQYLRFGFTIRYNCDRFSRLLTKIFRLPLNIFLSFFSEGDMTALMLQTRLFVQPSAGPTKRML